MRYTLFSGVRGPSRLGLPEFESSGTSALGALAFHRSVERGCLRPGRNELYQFDAINQSITLTGK
jgi:hypothetical protein